MTKAPSWIKALPKELRAAASKENTSKFKTVLKAAAKLYHG